MIDSITVPTTAVVPKGKVSVELMDAQGNVVEERHQDNYVNGRLLELIGEVASRSSFLGLDYQTSIDSVNSLSTQTFLGKTNLMHGLVLTDNAKTPDITKDRWVGGDVVGVGFFDRQYSEEKVGAYNPEESVISNGYIKLVYDFATSSANGTFQSVYVGNFARNTSNTENYAVQPLITSYFAGSISSVPYPSMSRFIMYKGNLAYYTTNSTTVTLNIFKDLTLNASINTMLTPTEVITFTHTLGTSIDNLYYAEAENAFYFIAYNRGELQKTTDFSTVSTVFTLNTIGVAMANNSSGLCISPKGNFFIHNTGRWVEVDKTSHKALQAFPATSSTSLNFSKVNPDIYYMGSSNPHVFGSNIVTGDRCLLASSDQSETRTGMMELSSDWLLIRAVIGTSTNSAHRMYIAPNYHFFSRALLDSPVTKTSQNSMKITYEYTFDSFDILK